MTAQTLKIDIVYHIDLQNDPDFFDDTARINAAAAWIADRLSIAQLTASISVVDDATIHDLNREHLAHDWPTDVISFEFERSQIAGELQVDGEVIASSDTARRLSKKAEWKPMDELLLYCIHGLLHVAGLDDIDDSDRQEMRVLEQDCLVALGIAGAEQHLKSWHKVSY